MPLITIIIVNYNGGDMLNRCLEAVCAQSYTEFAVFVVDNASKEQPIGDLPDDSRISLIRNLENVGFAAANNQVALEADTEWVVCLNPDTIAAPDWLEKLVAASQAHPEYDLFGSTLLDASNPDYIDGLGDELYVAGVAWRRDNGSARAEHSIEDGEVFGPCAAASMVRTELFQQIGGFHERFFCYMEDVDLAFRTRLRGKKALQVASSIVYHHGYAITGSKSDFMLYHSTRNMVWMFWRCMPLPLLLIALPFHIGLMLAMWLGASRQGLGKPVGRGLKDALIGLPKTLAERRSIQRARTASIMSIAENLLWHPKHVLAWRQRVALRDVRKEKNR